MIVYSCIESNPEGVLGFTVHSSIERAKFYAEQECKKLKRVRTRTSKFAPEWRGTDEFWWLPSLDISERCWEVEPIEVDPES